MFEFRQGDEILDFDGHKEMTDLEMTVYSLCYPGLTNPVRMRRFAGTRTEFRRSLPIRSLYARREFHRNRPGVIGQRCLSLNRSTPYLDRSPCRLAGLLPSLQAQFFQRVHILRIFHAGQSMWRHQRGTEMARRSDSRTRWDSCPTWAARQRSGRSMGAHW